MSKATVVFCAAIAFAWSAQSDCAYGQYSKLYSLIPDGANTIAIFDVEGVLASPMAVREGWAEKRTEEFVSGAVLLPPETNRFVLASLVDFEFMKSIWDVALLDLSHEPSLTEVARNLRGRIDQIAGLDAVSLPSDAFVVRFAENVFGTMAPGNRQTVGRWLSGHKSSSTPTLSPYIEEAIGFVENVGTPLIMAMDMEHTLTPQVIKEQAKVSPTLAGKNIDLDEFSEAIASIKGVTLGVTFRDKAFGKVKVDFGKDVGMVSGFAKPLILEVLANKSAMIEDFEDWTAKVDGNQVSIEGYFSESGLRRVCSLIEAPLEFLQASGQEDDPQADEKQKAEQTVQATQSYFNAIEGLLDDLKGRKGSANNINIYGVWFERYAGKVEKLPTLHVDPETLDYGNYIALSLRNASLAVKQKGIRSRARQVNEVANMSTYDSSYVSYSGGRWGRGGGYGGSGTYEVRGYYTPNQNLQRQQTIRTQIKTQETAVMAGNVVSIMQQVEVSRAEMRRKLTEKFQVQF